MKSVSVNVLLALAAGAAASPAGYMFERAAPVCDADNCLRAIRNTARPGLAECSSYLKATFTPATSTVYTTLSFTVTPTNTVDVTQTNTELATATVYEDGTSTQVVTRGVTTKPWKRQVTEIPSAIPTYASACSGAVRYSSACSCLGASATTITVDAPTTVITISETATPTTATELRTVQTDVVTVTDNTQTLITIVATKTVTTDEAIATITDFKLRVDSDAHKDQYLDFVANPAGNGDGNVKFGTAANADRFTISADGILVAPNGKVLNYPVPVAHNGYALIETYATVPSSRRSLNCQINTTSRELECGAGQLPATFVDCAGDVQPKWWTGVGVVSANCVPLKLAIEY